MNRASESLATIPETALRWKPLRHASEKIERLTSERAECLAHVEQLRAAVPAAEQRDREEYGRALAAGKRKPEHSEADEARRRLRDEEEKVAAYDAAVAGARTELAGAVEKHRAGWSADQQRAVGAARKRYAATIEGLVRDREQLIRERGLQLWLEGSPSAFPDNALAGRVGEDDGSTALGFARVVARLADDVSWLAGEAGDAKPKPPAVGRHGSAVTKVGVLAGHWDR